MLAIRGGYWECLQYYLENGGVVSPFYLYEAVSYGHVSVWRYLKETWGMKDDRVDPDRCLLLSDADLVWPEGVQIVERIGSGSSATVYRVKCIGEAFATLQWTPPSTDYAVKLYRETGTASSQAAQKEISILHALNKLHPQIAPHLNATWTVNGRTGLVMELYDGTLERLLKEAAPEELETIRQKVLAVVTCFEKTLRYHHDDLHLSNILYKRHRSSLEFVLADFECVYEPPTGYSYRSRITNVEEITRQLGLRMTQY